MTQKTNCPTCGSQTVPQDAKFCPNCGASLTTPSASAVDAIPTAAAVVVIDEDTLPPTPSSINVGIDNGDNATAPTVSAITQPPTGSNTSIAGASHDNTAMHGALYFKNPTPQMLEQANNTQSSGGVLFVQSPTNQYKGKFTLPKTVNMGHILSGDKMDLSRADFVHPVTTITVGAILGGIKVIVPRGVRVETRGFGILGGFKGIRSQTVHAGQDAPTIVLSGMTVLGGVDVKINENVPPVQVVP